MRIVGYNRASADWFLNLVAEKRRLQRKSCRWFLPSTQTPASNRAWNVYIIRPDEFHTAHRFPNARVHAEKGKAW